MRFPTLTYADNTATLTAYLRESPSAAASGAGIRRTLQSGRAVTILTNAGIVELSATTPLDDVRGEWVGAEARVNGRWVHVLGACATDEIDAEVNAWLNGAW